MNAPATYNGPTTDFERLPVGRLRAGDRHGAPFHRAEILAVEYLRGGGVRVWESDLSTGERSEWTAGADAVALDVVPAVAEPGDVVRIPTGEVCTVMDCRGWRVSNSAGTDRTERGFVAVWRDNGPELVGLPRDLAGCEVIYRDITRSR